MTKLMIKPLKRYEKQYYMLSDGRIWSRKRKQKSPHLKYSGYRTFGGHFLKPYLIEKTGYLFYTLNKNKARKLMSAHKLVANTFIPNIKNKPQINHKDGNKLNNNYDNLEWVTHKENHGHAASIGLMARGENHWNSILTEIQVKEIRKMHKHQKHGDKPHLKYNISRSTYDYVRNKKLWGWLDD